MINVFDIERYATKDGPGIRTVLFTKGCNLRCSWCQNPESQDAAPEVLFDKNNCASCGKCVDICPENAVELRPEYGYISNPAKCTGCGLCVDSCFYNARKIIGRDYDIQQLMKIILADMSFYRESGGGVTFSGGEPLLYHREIFQIAEECRRQGINTAIESALNADWNIVEKTAGVMDLFFADLKHSDEDAHRRHTGVGLEKIIPNLIKLGSIHRNVIVRMPVIPGVNHGAGQVEAMLDLISSETEIRSVELLPFHRLGSGKYAGLGRAYEFDGTTNIADDECRAYEAYGRNLGLAVRTGAV